MNTRKMVEESQKAFDFDLKIYRNKIANQTLVENPVFISKNETFFVYQYRVLKPLSVNYFLSKLKMFYNKYLKAMRVYIMLGTILCRTNEYGESEFRYFWPSFNSSISNTPFLIKGSKNWNFIEKKLKACEMMDFKCSDAREMGDKSSQMFEIIEIIQFRVKLLK